MKVSVNLWTINNILRFTGFRVFFTRTVHSNDPEDYTTRVGIVWCGSPFNDGSNRKKVDDAI